MNCHKLIWQCSVSVKSFSIWLFQLEIILTQALSQPAFSGMLHKALFKKINNPSYYISYTLP